MDFFFSFKSPRLSFGPRVRTKSWVLILIGGKVWHVSIKWTLSAGMGGVNPEACATGGGHKCIQWSAQFLIRHFFFPSPLTSVLGWQQGGGVRPDAPPRTVACLGDILLYMPIWTRATMECKEVCIPGREKLQRSNLKETLILTAKQIHHDEEDFTLVRHTSCR